MISDHKQTLIKISHTVDTNIIPGERNLNLKIEKKEGGKEKKKPSQPLSTYKHPTKKTVEPRMRQG